MKKYIIIVAVAIISLGFYWQVPQSATYFVFKVLTSNPTTPSAGKGSIFFRTISTDTGAFMELPSGATRRLDSIGTINTRQDTVFFRVGVVSRGTITTTDSLREVVIPVGSTWRIDSLKQWASNPSSLTYKLYKNVAGTVSQITNGDVSITSSATSTGGLQNNTSLTGNTELWVAITGGTADRARIEIIFKNQ